MGLATVSSSYIVAERGQDLTNTVTLATAASIVGWDVSANLYPYAGGPILATGTVTATNTATGVWSIAWSGEDLDLQGLYVWDFWRTDTGSQTPIVDVSGFQIRQSGALGSPTLTNFSEYMANLGMAGTITDTFLRQTLQFLAAAEAAITNAIGRKLTYDPEIIEYYDSWPDGGIALRRTPVACDGIYEVKFDYNGGYGQIPDSFGDGTELPEGAYSVKLDSFRNDGMSYSGILMFNDYNSLTTLNNTMSWGWAGDGSFGSANYKAWQTLTSTPIRLPGCIKVTYAAGYQLVPEDIKQAVFLLVRDRLNVVARGGSFVSESGEGYSYSLGPYTDEEKKLGSVQQVVNSYRSAEMLLG